MHVARSAAFLCVATMAFAAEPPPATPAAPPAEDAITAAKRDLETIKAARGGVEQARADLPRFSTPELNLGGSGTPARVEGRSAAEAAAAKKSANWLVDAMMKKPTTRAADGKERLPSSDGTEKDGAKGDTTDSRNALTAGDDDPQNQDQKDPSSRRDPKKPAEPVVNPLTSFMSGWMSASDYKLLQPGLGGESAANLVARGESAPAFSAATTTGLAGDVANPANFGRTAPGRSAPPRENPFLQALGPTPTPSVGPGGPMAAIPTASAPPPKVQMPLPDPLPPPQKSATPTFVKPNDDAKYFKPLKRF